MIAAAAELGHADTPEAAFNAAMKGAEELSSPPTEIYVGTIVEADPQAVDHAQRIVESMNRRAHVEYGDSAAKYLTNVTPEQVKELDAALAETILAWLKKHKLQPTFVQVRKIHERPVQFPGAATAKRSEEMETFDLGPESGY